MRLWIALLLLLLGASVAPAASLLPPGKQQFLGTNGAPLSGGKVYFYIPGTTTPKDTYKDAAQTILNTNPVQLDAGGYAIIYGTGAYRQVVKSATGGTLWDQLTYDGSTGTSSWAGTAGGTPNALTLNITGFSATDGAVIYWKAASMNTAAVTLTIGVSTFTLYRDSKSGVQAMVGGEMVAGGVYAGVYDATLGAFHLITPGDSAPFLSVASAANMDIGSLASPNISITGTTNITSFGSSATTSYPIYDLVFTGQLDVTYNATSLITPSAQNIHTKAGTHMTVQYLGSGNWRVLDYKTPGQLFSRHKLTASGTFNVPRGATQLRVVILGGGGGGGGTGDGTHTNGGNGGDSTFNGVTSDGGKGGSSNADPGFIFGGPGGLGGDGGAGAATIRWHGATGGAGAAHSCNIACTISIAGYGASTFLGGGGAPDPNNQVGRIDAIANTGSGGAGGTSVSTAYGNAGGGGAAEYVEVLIQNPAASYAYTIGAGGARGSGTESNGGLGSAGVILVDVIYDY